MVENVGGEGELFVDVQVNEEMEDVLFQDESADELQMGGGEDYGVEDVVLDGEADVVLQREREDHELRQFGE